jgi:hypothetical protein
MISSRKKAGYRGRPKQVLMILVSFILVFFSLNSFAHKADSPRRRTKTVKQVWAKINPFKKKNTETDELKHESVSMPQYNNGENQN